MKQKRRFTKLIVAAMAFFGVAFSASGCGESTAIKGIHMSNDERIDVPYGNFSYEGIKVTVDFESGATREIDLDPDMISEVEKLKFYKIGNQDVKVVFRSKYETEMPINVVLNQFNDVYELESYECVYDGMPHFVTLNHELPEGATIAYPYGNAFTNAGTYNVTGVISKKGYETKTLTATLTILQAERDASGIVFEDSTVTYNGEMQTIEAKNIPEGVEVTYVAYDYYSSTTVNKVVNAGKYRIVANFMDTNANYKKIPSKEAILTIDKANYDLSKIELNDVTKEYDGQEYAAFVKNANLLPTGVKVQFKYFNEEGKEVLSNADAGKYKMVAEFTGGDGLNYNPIPPMEAYLNVTRKIIRISDKISFNSKTVNFEENTFHSIFIEGELPSSVEVEYENNGQQYVGEYLITAKFKAKNKNEAVDVEELTAYLVINRVRRSVLVYDEEEEKYVSFSAKNIKIEKPNVTIEGYDTEVFDLVSVQFFNSERALIEPKDMISGTTYEYLIQFKYKDEKLQDSIILANETGMILYVEA